MGGRRVGQRDVKKVHGRGRGMEGRRAGHINYCQKFKRDF